MRNGEKNSEFDGFRELQKNGDFQFAFAGKVITNFMPNFEPTEVKVKLPADSESPAPVVVVPGVGNAAGKMTYVLEGQPNGKMASDYSVYLNDGATVKLSTEGGDSDKSKWTLYTHHMDNDFVKWEGSGKDAKLNIGGVTVIPERMQNGDLKQAQIHVGTRSGVDYMVQTTPKKIFITSLDAQKFESTEALLSELQRLRGLGYEPHANVEIKNVKIKINAKLSGEISTSDGKTAKTDMKSDDFGCYKIYYRQPDRKFVARFAPSRDELSDLPFIADIEGDAEKFDWKNPPDDVGRYSKTLFFEKSYSKELIEAQLKGEQARSHSKKDSQYYSLQFEAEFRTAQATYQFTSERLGRDAERLLEQILPSDKRENSQKGERQVDIYRLTVNGFASNDALVIRKKGALDGTVVLYLPSENPPFYRFDNTLSLLNWIKESGINENWRKMMLRHFPKNYASDTSIYIGVNNAFKKISLGSSGWNLIDISTKTNSITNGNVFSAIANTNNGKPEGWVELPLKFRLPAGRV
ncbi:dermonecrotic toxin domain-containing protein [Burkholderia ubonensis]|uniref:dermonecrotic toxin domain-containing protein n=1 Tax=Burkholderia ubonensis TaxID=101571 RepID=UPI0012FCD7A7|nr:DUF6543 domain-containing protein [Burkholderia ubonensis]